MTATAHHPIALQHLRELWVHTGTACNLSCPFCHEGSKPGDTRIAAPTLAQLSPLLDEAAARGVERFAFTGGEPLILKGILEILLHALALRPALVLTNGTAPFIRRAHHLALLRAAPHPLAFRVSIDHPDEARHDAGRGLKNFRKAMEGLRLLHVAGFEVGVTRQATAGEDVRFVETQFRRLLGKHGLPAELTITALPDLGALGAAGVPRVSGSANDPAAVVAVAASGRLASPACTRSRMLLARDGAVRVHACPLADDAARFDLGGSLDQAMASRVVPDHPRCSLCLAGAGVDYAGIPDSWLERDLHSHKEAAAESIVR